MVVEYKVAIVTPVEYRRGIHLQILVIHLQNVDFLFGYVNAN